MSKFWLKMSILKKMKSFYKSFYYLKASVIMFNECFKKIIFIGLISIQFTCSLDILKT
jgi:hypothetical protein